MEQILSDCPGTLNASDDIIVSGRDKGEHNQRLKFVLKRLEEFNVTLNGKKSIFGATEIDFLGHHLSKQGVKPTVSKIAAE